MADDGGVARDMRADFEAWARHYLLTTEPMASAARGAPTWLAGWFRRDPVDTDHYETAWTDAAWRGWQAGCAMQERQRAPHDECPLWPPEDGR